jgi:Spy/CpxP family protein refolding chaperone
MVGKTLDRADTKLTKKQRKQIGEALTQARQAKRKSTSTAPVNVLA